MFLSRVNLMTAARFRSNMFAEEDEDVIYTDGQIKAFAAVGVIEIVLYLGLLGLTIFNTYHFLYKQKRWRIYFIAVFYATAYLVVLSRLVYAIIQATVAFDHLYGNGNTLNVDAVLVLLII